MKANINKECSSSTLPIICTMAISANFTYSEKLQTRTWNVVTKCHILIKGLLSKGGAMHAIAFDFIINLNMPYWLSRSLALKTLSTKVSTPSNNCVLLEQKVILITTRCFGKDVIQFSYNQYWVYIIPKASMTPWAGNLVSNSWINVYATPTKASTLHNNKTTLDNQTCKHASNNPCKNMKIK